MDSLPNVPLNIAALVAIVPLLWWRISVLERKFDKWADGRDHESEKLRKRVDALETEFRALANKVFG